MVRMRREREVQLFSLLRSGRMFKMSWLSMKLGTSSGDIRKLVFDLERKGLVTVERLNGKTKYSISRS